MAGGEYDPTSTKVVHFVSNPAAEVARLQQEAQLDRMTVENKELRAALAAARAAAARTAAAGGGTAAGGGSNGAGDGGGANDADGANDGDDPAVAAAVAAAEVKLLQRKLSSAEKQVVALKEVFNKRVKAFRDSVK